MRNLKKNKQLMYFAPLLDNHPVYAKDEDGNILYSDVDGEQVPVELGYNENVYGEPFEVKAVITSELRNQVYFRYWGVDMAEIYSVIITKKNEYPINIGDIVWRESEPTYNEDGSVKQSSAEYTVENYMKESLFGDFWLLQRNNSEK